jgi:hypothetical protein
MPLTKDDTARGEDGRYYIECRKRNRSRIPLTHCFKCEFATGEADGQQIEIGCGFPLGRTMKKPWRRKGSNQPGVNKISRDGLS